jgi:hypothetical protein
MEIINYQNVNWHKIEEVKKIEEDKNYKLQDVYFWRITFEMTNGKMFAIIFKTKEEAEEYIKKIMYPRVVNEIKVVDKKLNLK